MKNDSICTSYCHLPVFSLALPSYQSLCGFMLSSVLINNSEIRQRYIIMSDGQRLKLGECVYRLMGYVRDVRLNAVAKLEARLPARCYVNGEAVVMK